MQAIANNLLKRIMLNYSKGKTPEEHLFYYEQNTDLITAEYSFVKPGDMKDIDMLNELILQSLIK